MHAYIIDALRTPRGRGRADGALNEVPPAQLAAGVLRAVADRHHVGANQVEDVVLGIVEPIGDQGGNLTRIAALEAGLGEDVAGMQINRYCASGLEAVATAASRIMAGQADLTIGGGVESMSRVPMTASGIPMALDADLAMPHYIVPQGIAADLMATKFGYSRADVDTYAAASQQRAGEAWSERRFDRSIVPVLDENGLTVLDRDELVRPDTTPESLGRLNPAFVLMGQMGGMDAVAIQKHPDVERIEHVHTAGNSSGIVDGAAAVLLASEAGASRLDAKPRAVIKGFTVIGTEPCIMLTGPESATERLLKRLGMAPSDVDLYELNEAFAAVVLRFMDELSLDHDRVNVNGGAIAMGHPLGATGAMILGTLLDELERRDLETGLATLCVGGGMGIALVIERVAS
ncbi:MAG: acetyl-CoA C-acetyltransferase [Pseudomonadota bacterium]